MVGISAKRASRVAVPEQTTAALAFFKISCKDLDYLFSTLFFSVSRHEFDAGRWRAAVNGCAVVWSGGADVQAANT